MNNEPGPTPVVIRQSGAIDRKLSGSAVTFGATCLIFTGKSELKVSTPAASIIAQTRRTWGRFSSDDYHTRIFFLSHKEKLNLYSVTLNSWSTLEAPKYCTSTWTSNVVWTYLNGYRAINLGDISAWTKAIFLTKRESMDYFRRKVIADPISPREQVDSPELGVLKRADIKSKFRPITNDCLSPCNWF